MAGAARQFPAPQQALQPETVVGGSSVALAHMTPGERLVPLGFRGFHLQLFRKPAQPFGNLDAAYAVSKPARSVSFRPQPIGSVHVPIRTAADIDCFASDAN